MGKMFEAVIGVLILAGLILSLLGVIFLKKPLQSIVTSILFCLFVGVGLFMLWVLALFSGKALFYSIIMLVFFIALIVLLVFLNLNREHFPGKKGGYSMVFPGLMMALCVCVAGAGIGTSMYDSTIPKMYETDPAFYYNPFDPREALAELPGPASLQLTGNLPRLDGATALYPVYAAFFKSVYPMEGLTKKDGFIKCSKTPEAYQNLMDGKADIIFCALPSKAQREEALSRGLSFSMTPIGKEAFVFFVNKRNPVDGLTTEQIQGIYSGLITNWKTVGGSFSKIKAFQRAQNSGSQTALQHIMGDVPVMAAPTETVSGMGEIIDRTANYKNYSAAIGFSFLFYATRMVQNDEIKLLAIDGVEPSRKSIQDGTYPMSDTFYAITLGNETGEMKAFIAWILSGEGQELVEKSGYTPLR